MGLTFPVMWAVIDPITGTVTTETRVSTHAPWRCRDAGFDPRALALLRRGFRPSRLGAAVLAETWPKLALRLEFGILIFNGLSFSDF